MMRRSLLMLVALVVAGPGISQIRGGADTAAADPVAQIATLEGKVSLADVVAACEQTANADQAGAVVIRGSLQDEDCQAIPHCAPCHPARRQGADEPHPVHAASQTLNVDDSASSAGNELRQADRFDAHWPGRSRAADPAHRPEGSDHRQE
jgi:hypothetical protein